MIHFIMFFTFIFINKIRPTFTGKTDLLIDKLFSNQISNQKTISWEG